MPFDSETAKLAGAKGKRGPSSVTKAAREFITDEDKQTAFLKLREQMNEGNIKAIELLLAYAFGKPQQSVDHTTGGEAITKSTLKLPDGTVIEI